MGGDFDSERNDGGDSANDHESDANGGSDRNTGGTGQNAGNNPYNDASVPGGVLDYNNAIRGLENFDNSTTGLEDSNSDGTLNYNNATEGLEGVPEAPPEITDADIKELIEMAGEQAKTQFGWKDAIGGLLGLLGGIPGIIAAGTAATVKAIQRQAEIKAGFIENAQEFGMTEEEAIQAYEDRANSQGGYSDREGNGNGTYEPSGQAGGDGNSGISNGIYNSSEALVDSQSSTDPTDLESLAMEQWEYYKSTYLPFVKDFAAELTTDSAGKREQVKNTAAADVYSNLDTIQSGKKSSLFNGGINPNSGNYKSEMASVASTRGLTAGTAIAGANQSVDKDLADGSILASNMSRGIKSDALEGLSSSAYSGLLNDGLKSEVDSYIEQQNMAAMGNLAGVGVGLITDTWEKKKD